MARVPKAKKTLERIAFLDLYDAGMRMLEGWEHELPDSKGYECWYCHERAKYPDDIKHVQVESDFGPDEYEPGCPVGAMEIAVDNVRKQGLIEK